MTLRFPRGAMLPSRRSGLLAAALWLTAAPGASAGVIELKERCDVTGPVVCLADVATVRDANPELAGRLAALVLAPSPAEGRAIELDYDTIRARLGALGVDLAQHEFMGSSRVRVTGSTARPGAKRAAGGEPAGQRALDQAARAIAGYVRSRAPGTGGVHVELLLEATHRERLAAAASARLEVSGGKAPFTGEQNYRLGFRDGLGNPQFLDVACRVEPLPRVVVARRNVPRGAVLRDGDIELRQLEPVEYDERASWLTEPETALGSEAKKVLRAGMPIAAGDLRRVPLVRRGDLVTVKARNGGIVVRMDAKAQGDGGRGDIVRFVSLDGRRELQARVVGFHEAEVIGAQEPAAEQALGAVRFVWPAGAGDEVPPGASSSTGQPFDSTIRPGRADVVRAASNQPVHP